MRFLDVYGRFWTFQEVSQSCDMLQLGVERCSGVSSVCKYALTIISVKILHKCDETSWTVARIAVSLKLKWEVVLTKRTAGLAAVCEGVKVQHTGKVNGFLMFILE